VSIDLGIVAYNLSFLLMLLGIYCALSHSDIIKVVCGLSISSYGVTLFVIQIGYTQSGSTLASGAVVPSVDPLMEALVLTAVVIETGFMMLMLAIGIRIFQEEGHMDLSLLRRLRG
jgi:multicomponent Na+:H+ antiporter subunit C